jgi:hypothetical protein
MAHFRGPSVAHDAPREILVRSRAILSGVSEESILGVRRVRPSAEAFVPAAQAAAIGKLSCTMEAVG